MAVGRDRVPVVAALIVLVVLVGYVTIMQQQGDPVVAWFLGGLVVAALLGIYGAARAAPRRRLALAVGGVVLTILGVLGILSIGFPILVAGLLLLVAAARSPAT